MTLTTFAETFVVVLALWFLGKMILFGILYRTSFSVPKGQRSRFGRGLRGLFAGLTVTSFGLGFLFTLRAYNGPSTTSMPEPTEVSLGVSLLLFGGLLAVSWFGVELIRATWERQRKAQAFAIDNAAVLGSLGQAMPIVVADHRGTIRHTTDEFDALVGYRGGELIGRDLQVLMPERYEHDHQRGIDHYVKTRDPHIIGTVVGVDMLHKDGNEVPVYLALNTTDVEGDPWFVASMWSRPLDITPLRSTFSPTTAETIDATHEDVEEVRDRVERIERKIDGPDP